MIQFIVRLFRKPVQPRYDAFRVRCVMQRNQSPIAQFFKD